MGRKTKGKQRLDKYWRLAKETGYRSRAAFKLLQLDSKYQLFHSARSVLDLCAAPGGWLQVAVQKAPTGSFVLGVDLVPIRPVRGAHAIAEDITTPRCRAAVKKLMDSNGCAAFDLVLHDGSPNVGGAWASEATMQSALVIDSLKLATELLVPKGNFVTKVFRSQDYSAILYCLKQLFDKVEVTKPEASRKESAEIYVIGLRYKAPAKIDPRLLDVKHLFQGAIEPPKVVDVLRGTKQKRNREGYEDGVSTLWKVGKVSDFVWSEAPLDFLGSVNALSFENEESLPIKDNELTTEEVKSLCEDLYVLDKHSFKHLLRWRLRIRKALSSVEKTPQDSVTGTRADVDDDDRLLNEMEELTSALEQKKRRARKILAKRLAKDKSRKATGMQVDATMDSYFDGELFSLSSIKKEKQLKAISTIDLDNENINTSDSDDDRTYTDGNLDSRAGMESDEERRQYDEQLEDMLDKAYENFMTRKGGNTKESKRRQRDLSSEDTDLLEAHEEDEVPYSDQDSDKDANAKERNSLLVPLHDFKPSQEQIMENWFSQDIFAEAEEMELEKSDSEDEREDKPKDASKRPSITTAMPKDVVSPKSHVLEQEGFEIVPAEPLVGANESSDDESTSDESDEEDEDTKAEILAYAKKMLRKRKREEIIDDAYNKYMFDDENLPRWFAEEEKRHSQPIKPVTKEEVAATRAQFKEIDARPAKKVAEARARKKRVAQKKLEKVRQKSNSIAEQTDISERSKSKMINQLYRKAKPKKPQKEFVVAKKGVQVKAGKGKKLVDRRMKKDARQRGMGKLGQRGKVMKAKGKKAQKSKGGAKATGKNGGKTGKRGEPRRASRNKNNM